MRRFFVNKLCVGALFLTFAFAQAGQIPPFKTFDVTSDPIFKGYKEVVTKYANQMRPKAPNDFCIFGYVTDDNLKSAWVIWRQRKQIILWEGGTLEESRRKIHLSTDVVATEADLHGSTYRVTKAWVNEVKTTCEQSGVKVHVPSNKISD